MEIDRSSFCYYRFYRFLYLNDWFYWFLFLIEKYRKHKKHNHSISQHTSVYRLLRFSFEWKKKSDSRQFCDYRFLSIITTNQSTNIKCYRVLSINQLHFWWSISIDLWCAVNNNVGAPLAQDTPYKLYRPATAVHWLSW